MTDLEQTDDVLLLKKVIQLYQSITGLESNYFLVSGESSCASCPVCDNSKESLCCRLRSTPEGQNSCSMEIGKAGLSAYELGQPYIYVCYAGLVEWAVPIIKGSEYLGVLVSGRVRLWKTGRQLLEDMEARLASANLREVVTDESIANIPYMSPRKVQETAQLLFMNVCYIMGTDSKFITEKRNIWKARSSLAEEMARQKISQSNKLYLMSGNPFVNNGAESRPGNSINPQREIELIGRIRLGDRSAVKEILNEVLGGIFLNPEIEFNEIKALLIELFIAVGRAAIQRRTPGEHMFRLYTDAIHNLQQTPTIEGIYLWTVTYFDKLTDAIYSSRDDLKYDSVEQVISYLKANYATDLNVNDIAKAVHLSPFYLSRIFKEELGITMIEYLTEVRISAARNLLESSDLVLKDIAQKVGYSDVTYFSRLFKKRMGISANEYRRWWKREKEKN